MPNQLPPALTIDRKNSEGVLAAGAWQVHTLGREGVIDKISEAFASVPKNTGLRWDLSQVSTLDYFGAQLFWNAWGKARPSQLVLSEQHDEIFRRIEKAGPLAMPELPSRTFFSRETLLRSMQAVSDHFYGFIALIGQLILDIVQFVGAPQRGPWKEVSASIYHAGYQALGITALVGFLIGVVLSYLSAQQLHTFGADIYLVNILGMSIIRELGPLLAAILVAGRSGSSITAQLGVMRVTEELDAMLVMGMPHGFRLIMPKVVALAIAMPLLVVWTDAMALMGGMAAASVELGLSPTYFLRTLPDAVPLANYWIGLGKGVVFGSLIALVACHFGLRIKPNTESLGAGTTVSVVSAITIVILADAVFAIVFKGVGF
ncbi:ABC transporter permease [soil metagenome]